MPQLGRVIVVEPKDDGNLYPGDWYGTGAAVLKNMLANEEVDIHDSQHILEYYTRLYQHLKDDMDLVKGLREKDYVQVEDAYQLIPKQGVQVIVPYQEKAELYQQISAQVRESGITAELMKLAAPITVSTFDKMLDLHGEPLRFFGRRHRGEPSGCFLLLVGHEDCYRSDMGLQFREEQPGDFLL